MGITAHKNIDPRIRTQKPTYKTNSDLSSLRALFIFPLNSKNPKLIFGFWFLIQRVAEMPVIKILDKITQSGVIALKSDKISKVNTICEKATRNK